MIQIGHCGLILHMIFFLPPDVDAVLNIPICTGGGDDILAWAHEKSGDYSMKSVYHTLVNQKDQLALEEGTVTGTSRTENTDVSTIWKLKVIPKVRVFW